jgi:Fur family transcriptional regulator, zinc uptake regulator
MSDATAFHSHDHGRCTGTAMAHAERLARDRGLRLTPVRRRALEILLEEHRALGAYEVLERLAADGFGNQPPVAYRALDFLVEHGLAHRIRRLNAYAACTHPGEGIRPPSSSARPATPWPRRRGRRSRRRWARRRRASALPSIRRMNVEAVGLCPACGGPA